MRHDPVELSFRRLYSAEVAENQRIPTVSGFVSTRRSLRCRSRGAKINPLISMHTFDTSPFARTCVVGRSFDELLVLTQISPSITLALPPEHPQSDPKGRRIFVSIRRHGKREQGDEAPSQQKSTQTTTRPNVFGLHIVSTPSMPAGQFLVGSGSPAPQKSEIE